MPKITIASLTAQNEELRQTLKIATEQTEAERSKRYDAQRERDGLAKSLASLQQERDNARLDAERHRGMIEILERLGTIPKQQIEYDAYGNPTVR